MKVLSTDGLTKLIQLIKGAFISVDDTVNTNSVTLATVATSGSYNDLSNKPTIPAEQVNADWNATSGKAQILNKPTIPTVPTNVSAFTNDAGYLTEHQSLSGYVPTSRTVNGKALTSNITLSASDVSALPSSTVIPTISDTYSATSSNGMSGKAVASAISGKANSATSLSGYGITDAYTKTEADTAISTAIAGASHLKRLIVTQLPSPSSADENTVYMVLKSSGISGNIYDEYLLIDGAFEKIGDTQVDLSGYVTSVNNVSPVNGNVTLSIPDAQIQSDWNQATTTAKDYIKNKPTLATVATSGSYADLSNKPSIPTETTEATVSGWGFTKNTGTVTSVNNVSPVNGNVSLTIPTVPTIATTVSSSSTNSETVGAKLFYDTVGNIESALNTINSGV